MAAFRFVNAVTRTARMTAKRPPISVGESGSLSRRQAKPTPAIGAIAVKIAASLPVTWDEPAYQSQNPATVGTKA